MNFIKVTLINKEPQIINSTEIYSVEPHSLGDGTPYCKLWMKPTYPNKFFNVLGTIDDVYNILTNNNHEK